MAGRMPAILLYGQVPPESPAIEVADDSGLIERQVRGGLKEPDHVEAALRCTLEFLN